MKGSPSLINSETTARQLNSEEPSSSRAEDTTAMTAPLIYRVTSSEMSFDDVIDSSCDEYMAGAAVKLAKTLGSSGHTPVIWVADTGSGNHLAGRAGLSKQAKGCIMKSNSGLRLATANGVIDANAVLDLYVPEMGVKARVLVLDNSPNVISVGRLVEDSLYEFHWRPGEAWFTSPDGRKLSCRVHNYVPLIEGSAVPMLGDSIAAERGSSANVAEVSVKFSCDDDAEGVKAVPADEVRDAGDQGGDPDVVCEEVKPTDARLKREAASLQHLLTHYPKNPYCKWCSEGKAFQKPARRRRPVIDEVPKDKGHTLLADHFSPGERGIGLHSERVGLMLKDLGTGMKMPYGLSSKSKADTVIAIRHLGGATRWTNMASDSSLELIAAAESELMVHLRSTPYRPESNGIIEREIGLLGAGIRTLLCQAGLPHSWWVYAGRHFCHSMNVNMTTDPNPWQLWHNCEFTGAQFAFGSLITFRLPVPYRSSLKFDPRAVDGIFVGYELNPGNAWTGDYLVAELAAILRADPMNMKVTIHRVKEVTAHGDRIRFPLREAKDAARDKRLAEQASKGSLDNLAFEPIVGGDSAIPDILADDDQFELDPMPVDSVDAADAEAVPEDQAMEMQTRGPIPRAKRIFTPLPRSAPPPPAVIKEAFEMQDDTALDFQSENPKRPGSKSYKLYDQYKTAKTVAEAESLGATRGHIRYDLSKGFAHIMPVLICFGMVADSKAPLLEGWCSPNSQLGNTGKTVGRDVLRFTEADDLAQDSNVSRALDAIRVRPGTHLHGSLPCTPWTTWQRLNYKRGSERTRARIDRGRLLSRIFVRNFERLGRAALNGGGSVSFEWPRFCDGWKDDTVKKMVASLKLQPIAVDGCSVGLSDPEGVPIFKPWRVMVSSPHMASALEGLRCSRDHEHRQCKGGTLTSSTAYYPEKLCEAIHEGLDRHERSRTASRACASLHYDPDQVRPDDIKVDQPLTCDPLDISYADLIPGASDSPPRTGHRCRNDPELFGVWTALVTRIIPAKTDEFKSAACQAALKDELARLRKRGCWDESTVMEFSALMKEKRDCLVGRLFGIMGEKNAESSKPADQRTYKARVVFAGNNVQTTSGVPAWELYQEVSQAPAAMQTVRAALGIAGLRGMIPKVRDATQAYIQARIDTEGRPETWVRLPRQWWPAEWYNADGAPRFADPVIKLRLALFGHPESGAPWDKHLSGILKGLGWRRLHEHPGFWIHKSSAVMTVYVDDLMMAAPADLEQKLWAELESQVEFGEAAAPLGKFLGGIHEISCKGDETYFSVHMEAFLRSAVDTYMEEIGVTSLTPARTPYLMEDFVPWGKDEPGAQASTASSHLMKILLAARMCRPELVVGITRLASKVSKWQKCHDKALKRLFEYISAFPHLELTGVISTRDLEDCVVAMSPDADLNGDLETTKSTSGLWVELRSSCGTRCWPIAWRSKKQGSTASSTCEAETISMATGLKLEAVPLAILFSEALNRDVKVLCLEDNTQCISAVKAGYSPSLRHLPRTERISLGVVHEFFVEGANEYILRHQPSEFHKGDIFTKRLDPIKFEKAVPLLGLRPRTSKE